MGKIDISIVIVSYNTRELLRNCLQSISKVVNTLKSEVIVVDNGSSDGSAQMVKEEFPDVTTYELSENKGFAGANNIGLKKTHGRYALLLNSDTTLEPTVIEQMVAYMDAHPDVAVATCKVMLASGLLDPACHRGFPTPWAAFTYFSGLERFFPTSYVFSQYHLGYKGYDTVHEIDCPSGAFFLVRESIIKKVGLLDEDYFMYGEDIDWAYRIKKAGWKIMYVPSVSIVHHKKQSGRLSEDRDTRLKTNRSFYETMIIFYEKNYAHVYPKIVTNLVKLLVKIRLLLVS